jgi:hypothetical protein
VTRFALRRTFDGALPLPLTFDLTEGDRQVTAVQRPLLDQV